MDKKHIILTISVLTSRKEDQVRRCLESLRPIRDAVSSELIVVDTSEDAHMHKVLQEYTDHIVPFHWIQDFSAARNAGLREASGEWFLYLDDDEWFSDSRSIIRFFASGEYKKYNGGMYIQRNYSNMEGTKWSDAWVARFAKIVPGLHFTSPIHEHFSPIPDENMALRSIVDHYGYVFTTWEAMLEHYERNKVLLEKMIEQHPDSPRWRLQMLQEYRSVQKYEEMFAFARECLNYYENVDKDEVNLVLPAFYAAELEVYDEWYRDEMSYKVCETAQKDARMTRMGQAYFDIWRAKFELEQKHYKAAENAILRYLEAWKYFEDNLDEKLKQGYPTYLSDTFTEDNRMLAYSLLICAGLWQEDAGYLKRYYSSLKLDRAEEFAYPAFARALIHGMETVQEDDTFTAVLKKLNKNEELWQQFEIEMLQRLSKDDSRIDTLIHLVEKATGDASFLQFYSLRKKLAEPKEETNGEEIAGMLKEYAELGLRYYGSIYKETELPGDYRAARILEKVLAANSSKEKVGMLREVVGAYPPFAKAIRCYAEWLGESEHAVREQEANPQLRQMADQVLGNVSVMLENGMIEEAYKIVVQLRGMLPEDQELKEMEEQLYSYLPQE